MLRAKRLADEGNLCSFGITESIAAAVATGLGGLGLGGGLIGTAAAPGLIATGLAGAAEGAAGGAALGGLTGSGAGKGALFGGLTGGAIGGIGPALGSAAGAAGLPAGVASTAGDVAAGIGGGVLGSAATGQPLLTGALEGGAGGLATGLAGGGAAGSTATPSPSASSVPAGGLAGASASPASAALPGGGVPVSGDLLGPSTTLPSGGGGSFGNFGLTQDVGPGVIGGGSNIGGAEGGSFDPSAATLPSGTADQDFSGGAGGGAGGFLGKIGSTIANNPGVLASGGILGLEALKQNQPLPEQAQLNKIGATTAAEGNQLASYVATGTLPPGAQESINLATTAAKSQVRSTAAQLGLSGSTWEADRMAQIDQQASAQGEQIAQQLLSQGANYTQLSSGVFENLLKSTLDQDAAFQRSLSQFAAGLAGAKLNTGGG